MISSSEFEQASRRGEPVAEVVRLQPRGLELKSHDFSYGGRLQRRGLELKSHDFSYGASASPLARLRRSAWRLLAGLALLTASACQQQMGSQPSYRPLQPSDFFDYGRSSRPVLPGTVARGQLRTDTALFAGKDSQGEFVQEIPFELSEYVLKRGEQRFNIFCSVCHGLTGEGDGRIVQRGFTKPPNFHTDDSRAYKLKGQKLLPSGEYEAAGQKIPLRDVAVGYIFEVITHGYGAMPDYESQIPVRDRWAIVAYVRALQLSQASPEDQKKMEEAWARIRKGEKK
jgi:mono/diheme cytochrome c family protein